MNIRTEQEKIENLWFEEEDTYANSCDDENCKCREDYNFPDNIVDGCPYATNNKKEKAS